MSQEITIKAAPRSERGSANARRLRRTGRVPATVYGYGESVSISIDTKDLGALFRGESGQNTIFKLEIEGGESTAAILREMQRDPVKGRVMHADLSRIRLDKATRVTVPVHLKGEPRGVKTDGGILEFHTRELLVECLPGDIPDSFTVDVSDLGILHHISVKDLPASERVKILADPELVIASVLPPKMEVEAAAPAQSETAEPEVIKKGKGEDEGTGSPEKAPQK